MFEKEAEEYQIANSDYSKTNSIADAFQDGAEFGYNKGFEFGVKSNEKVNQIVTNEWHYPSKGENPEDEFTDEYRKSRLPSAYKRHYCLYLGGVDCVMGKYMRGLFLTVEGQYSLSEIVAWKEIVLPKEIE